MQKKSIIAILSAVVLMVVASLALVFTIGPHVSADSGFPIWRGGALDKAEYFNIDENGVLSGVSNTGGMYITDNLHHSPGFLYQIIVPEGVKEIRKTLSGYGFGYAFKRGLSSASGQQLPCYQLFLPNSLEVIRYAAFSFLDFTKVKIPSNVKIIEGEAFRNCRELTTVIIPASVTDIAYDVFYGCKKLTEIIVESEALYNHPALAQYKDKMNLQLHIPNTVTFITNGGSVVDGLYVEYDKQAIIPTSPTREGYNFEYWYLDDENEPYDFNTPVTNDLILNAKWTEIIPEPESPTEPKPETPAEENAEVNNQNNNALIWGIAGTSAGILIIGGIVFGIVITKRRRK